MSRNAGAAVGHSIPTLDGWRCIAIVLVLLSHFQAAFLQHLFWDQKWLNAGQHGVQIFFVLSGYLITTNLLNEEKIHLVSFYVRRFFRLLPAAWLYLLFLAAITAFTRLKTIGHDAWACLFFYRNYVLETPGNTCTEHFWSLSLEEQFYLVWPPVLVLLGRKPAAILAAFATIGVAIYRIAFWNYFSHGLRFQHTEMRADALLVGCLLAYVLRRSAVREWIQKNGTVLFLGCIPPLLWDIYRFQDLIPLHETLLIAVVLSCTSLNPGMLFSRFLEWENIRFTGVISYSIYLWQGVFLRPAWGIFGPFLLPVAFLASYFLVERPCIRFARRLVERMGYAKPSVAPVSVPALRPSEDQART